MTTRLERRGRRREHRRGLAVVLLAAAWSGLTADAAGQGAGEPERVELRIAAWPADRRAAVEVRTASGELLRGRAPWRRRLVAGPAEVSVRLRHHRPWQRKLVLQGALVEVTACLDPEDQIVRCQHIVPVGLRPKAVLVAPGGNEVWVAQLIGSPALRVFSSDSGAELAAIRLGTKGATELELSGDGTRVFASQMATARVYEVDIATRRPLREFQTRGAWTKVMERSPDGRSLYASNWVSHDVSEIDLATGKLRRRIKTVEWPRGMYATPDGKHLFVAGFKNGELQKIDLASGRGKIIFARGRKLRHIVADETKRRLYVSDLGGDWIYTVDLETDEVKRFVKTARTPNTIALSPDRRVLFVSNRGRGSSKSYLLPGPEWGLVQLFDTGTRKLLDVIVGGNQPTALDLSDDGRLLVFSDFLDDRIRIYSVPPYEEFVRGGGGRARSYLRDLRKP